MDVLEERIQRDEGGRGIKPLIIPGELELASKAVLGAEVVVILTGFPCLLDRECPTETDGPSGAIAVALAVVRSGKKAVIAVDECNAKVLQAGLSQCKEEITLEVFPPASAWDDAQQKRLAELGGRAGCVVALERAGPGKDGKYYTMRARDMTSLLAPLDRLFDDSYRSSNGFRYTTVGIGDGGNEVGMGKVMSKVVEHIPNGETIACTSAADHLIVASVSNWGGYALAAAVSILSGNRSLLLTSDEETAVVSAVVDAGARDGPTGQEGLFVDGMPLQTSLDVLEDLRTAAAL
mmetsp:Transcript_22919/g.55476  ORF Transcript_22919/g.55476 Transcript_22919/m.55476 type:complete len:293 (+) Transcript_22919:34-912(+)